MSEELDPGDRRSLLSELPMAAGTLYLALPELRIQALPRKQIVVRALLADPPLIQDDDLVGVHHRR
jgi:hypothetical protein